MPAAVTSLPLTERFFGIRTYKQKQGAPYGMSDFYTCAVMSGSSVSHHCFLSCVACPLPTLQVFVLMLRDSQQEMEYVQELIRSEEELGVLDNAYIVYLFSPNSVGEEVNGGNLPTKALLNAVGDLCQTRYTLPRTTSCLNPFITRQCNTLGSAFVLVRGTVKSMPYARGRQQGSALEFISSFERIFPPRVIYGLKCASVLLNEPESCECIQTHIAFLLQLVLLL